jgi:hypothetical protein
MAEPSDSGGFLARWGRRKTQARAGEVLADVPVVVAPVSLPTLPIDIAEPLGNVQPLPVEAPALPTLADVALLNRDSDYARFVAGGVDESVKRAAMKKLFSDPHFNVMDGLDIYIDDYTQADPIPLAMLREMNQSKVLKLFEEDDEAGSAGVADNSLAPAAPAEASVALEAPQAAVELAAVVPADSAHNADPEFQVEAQVEATEPQRAP